MANSVRMVRSDRPKLTFASKVINLISYELAILSDAELMQLQAAVGQEALARSQKTGGK